MIHVYLEAPNVCMWYIVLVLRSLLILGGSPLHPNNKAVRECTSLTLNACCSREWRTSFVFINFEYESNGFCKYGKGEICWHGVGENYHDFFFNSRSTV